MSATATALRSDRWRVLAALALLGVIGFASWKSIPRPRAVFTPAELAISHEYTTGAEFALAPDDISGGVARTGKSVRVYPGGALRFEVSRIAGLLRGRFAASDEKVGAVADFLAIGGPGTAPVTVLRRELRSAAGYDSAPRQFLLNTAMLPPGTKSVLLSVPADSPGAVEWTKVGSRPPEKVNVLSALPLALIAYDGFAEPAADGASIFVHAPFQFIFQVPPGPREFTGSFGLNPALFSRNDADSDGIGVRFVLETGGERQTLLARQFDPRNHPEDRQLAPARLALAGAPGSRLIVSVDAGPGGSLNWDWTVLQDLKVDPPVRP